MTFVFYKRSLCSRSPRLAWLMCPPVLVVLAGGTRAAGRQVVHEYRPLSGPHYVLAQLLQWHNHGEFGNASQGFDDMLRG